MLVKVVARIFCRHHPFAQIWEIEARRSLGRLGGGDSITLEVKSALKLLKAPKNQELYFWDIGSNIGDYVIELMRLHSNLTVVAFEPSATAFNALTKRFLEDKRIALENVALGNSEGETILFADFPGSGLGSLTLRNLDFIDVGFAHVEEIQISTGSSFLNKYGRVPDFIKIDVEGHEIEVLRGFGERLSDVSLIQFEFGGCNIDTRTYFKDFWLLLSADFTIHRITPNGLITIEKYSEQEESFMTSNFLAQRNV